ncbi:MAG: hypothetical protein R2940_05755 [Syntrophotaleaceae bacterium]
MAFLKKGLIWKYFGSAGKLTGNARPRQGPPWLNDGNSKETSGPDDGSCSVTGHRNVPGHGLHPMSPVIMLRIVAIVGFGPADIVAGFILHSADAGLFPRAEVAVLKGMVFCSADVFLIMAQVPQLLFGDLSGSDALVNSVLLVLLPLSDRACCKGSRTKHECSKNRSDDDDLFHDCIPFWSRLMMFLPLLTDH